MINRLIRFVRNAPTRIRRKLLRRGAAVVNFHHIGEANEFVSQLGITISSDDFESRIKFLKSNFEVVPFSVLCKQPNNRSLVAITFDDGYRSYLTEALPILQKYNCPSKVFLNSNQVEGSLSWLNKLSAILESASKNEQIALAHSAVLGVPSLDACDIRFFRKSFSYPRTNLAIDKAFSMMDVARESWRDLYLGVEDLRFLAQHELVELGSHTSSHYPLLSLDAESQRIEILGGHESLRKLIGPALLGFALPFGGTSLRTVEIAALVSQIDEVLVTATNERIFKNQIGALTEIQRIAGDGAFDQLKKHLL